MKQKLLEGASCDVVILTAALIEQLTASGHVLAGSARHLGPVKTGVAVKHGTPYPLVETAEQLKGELDAKYASRKAEIDAFRNQPIERVMERLGERLAGTTINIQPYADDATPSRVRYEEARPQ